jgi:hypothetical protein
MQPRHLAFRMRSSRRSRLQLPPAMRAAEARSSLRAPSSSSVKGEKPSGSPNLTKNGSPSFSPPIHLIQAFSHRNRPNHLGIGRGYGRLRLSVSPTRN